MGYQLVLVPMAVRSGASTPVTGLKDDEVFSRRRMALGLRMSAPIAVGGVKSRPSPRFNHSRVTPCQTLLTSWYSTRRNPSTRGNLEADAPTEVGAFQAPSTPGSA